MVKMMKMKMSMMNAISAAVFGVTLFAASVTTVQGARQDAKVDAKQIELGMKVYVDQKCALCHSIAGKGNPKGALDGVGSRLTADELREWMVNPAEMTKKAKAERKPAMRAYPKLPKEELDAVVAYMLSLKAKK
jgi:mono/diheme cytochrome c family protein